MVHMCRALLGLTVCCLLMASWRAMAFHRAAAAGGEPQGVPPSITLRTAWRANASHKNVYDIAVAVSSCRTAPPRACQPVTLAFDDYDAKMRRADVSAGVLSPGVLVERLPPSDFRRAFVEVLKLSANAHSLFADFRPSFDELLHLAAREFQGDTSTFFANVTDPFRVNEALGLPLVPPNAVFSIPLRYHRELKELRCVLSYVGRPTTYIRIDCGQGHPAVHGCTFTFSPREGARWQAYAQHGLGYSYSDRNANWHDVLPPQQIPWASLDRIPPGVVDNHVEAVDFFILSNAQHARCTDPEHSDWDEKTQTETNIVFPPVEDAVLGRCAGVMEARSTLWTRHGQRFVAEVGSMTCAPTAGSRLQSRCTLRYSPVRPRESPPRHTWNVVLDQTGLPSASAGQAPRPVRVGSFSAVPTLDDLRDTLQASCFAEE